MAETQQRKWSQQQEKRFAKAVGGKLTPNSGSRPMPSQKGDFQDDDLLWEHKGSRVESRLVLDATIIGKVYREAHMAGKRPAIGLTLGGLPSPPPQDWVAVPLAVWEDLVST